MPRLSNPVSKRLVVALREALVLLLLAGAASGVSTWMRGGLPQRPQSEEAVEIAPGEAVKLAPLWIDVRPGEQYIAGHIPGAVPLDLGRYEALLPAVLDQWTQGRAAVVYGGAPGEADSREAAARLRDFKLGRVWVLKGGWGGWQAWQSR